MTFEESCSKNRRAQRNSMFLRFERHQHRDFLIPGSILGNSKRSRMTFIFAIYLIHSDIVP